MAYVKKTLVDNETIVDKELLDHFQDGIMGIGFSFAPHIEMGHISPSKGTLTGTYYGKQYYRTSKFLCPITNSISVISMSDCDIRVCLYDKDFSPLGALEWTSLLANTSASFMLPDECCFIKGTFRKDSSLTEFHIPHVIFSNVESKEYYNIRPTADTDDGFIRLVIPVNVADVTSSDAEEWVLQDTPEILPDYGVLLLPETYSNVGKPTRLIIYCHGAGVAYGSDVTAFPVSDCEPEYWLGEGCAVMDIEGNPFDNANRHGYMPQGIQCYENAYDWVVRNFNICQDGVFLGGRSMGGGMCFEILQSAIPVIAACPVVPVANTLWWWNYMPASYRKFCATHMGFEGDYPSSTGSYILSDDEWQYLQDNFDKMVRYSPLWRGIDNLPDKETLFSVGHLNAKTVKEDADEAALYNTLRFKVKAPTKIFTCYEDTTVPYARNAVYMYNMMKNAGQVCELRLFSSDAAKPHHFEQQDSRAYIDVTTIYGEVINAPLVYAEMMQFWRRYEKTVQSVR